MIPARPGPVRHNSEGEEEEEEEDMGSKTLDL